MRRPLSSKTPSAARRAPPAAVAVSALAALATLATLGGCENQYYCEGRNPLDNCLAEAADVCERTADCLDTPATPVCDTAGSHVCVQCLEGADAAACQGTTPVCAGTACRACSSDDDCPGGTCLPDGACGGDQAVAYVTTPPRGTDNATCTKAAPCTKVASALQTGRPYVRLAGTLSEAVTLDGTTEVTFLAAPGASLTRPGGVGIELKGSARLTIYDLEIAGPPGGGAGISMPTGNAATLSLVRARVTDNDGGGLVALGGTLELHQSTFLGNQGGGASIAAAKFEIINNFFLKNGDALAGTVGGVRLSALTAPGSRFEHNTVSRNLGGADVTTGVACRDALVPVALAGNLVYGNLVSGAGRQVTADASCAWTYSNIGPEPLVGGSPTNLNMAPAFADPDNNDFHLLADSAGKDAADPASTVSVDFEGDPRPTGAGPDIGADEIE